jgi:hypothetical protein
VTVEGTPIDREKLLSLSYLSRGRTRNHVREGRDTATGERFKAVTDELGNTVTQRGDDRQDVKIRAPHVVAATTVREERD